MFKFLSKIFLLVVITSSLSIISCSKEEEANYDSIKNELDHIQELQTDTSNLINDLRIEIKALEIEKQKLLAEKKRLEAEIIELQIKDMDEEKSNSN